MNVGTGRFISQDTYEGSQFDPKSLHKYTYTENDAVNNLDPSGNMTLGEAVQVAGIYANLATMALLRGRTFLLLNIDKIIYWATWAEIGLTTAQFVGSVVGEFGFLEYTTRNSSPTGGTGARGEDIWLDEMRSKGFTDVLQIQNESGHGIDAFGRDAKGRIPYFEVKSTTGSSAPSLSPEQHNDPIGFIRSRLQRAANAQG